MFFVCAVDKLKNADATAAFAIDTVVVTNALFQLKCNLPKVENPTFRAQAAKEVKDLIEVPDLPRLGRVPLG